MKFKEARLSAGLKQTEVIQRLKKTDNRMDSPTLSKYETGLCLPTVPQFHALCEILRAEPKDLLAPSDVDFGLSRRGDRHKDAYRLCARIPTEYIGGLEAFKKQLKVCGYASITAWVYQCIKRLQAEYAQRKNRPDAATSKAVQEKIS